MTTAPPSYDQWYAGKDLTADWTSNNFMVWEKVLVRFRPTSARILEIGSYEGRSAIFFLNFLPASKIVCIDVFGVYDYAKNWPDIVSQLPRIETRFDQNLKEFSGRVKKIKGNSSEVLRRILFRLRRFHIVYVDGDHRAEAAYQDCKLSWPLVLMHGIMIIDDYEFDKEQIFSDRPGPGVDRFLNEIAGQFEDVHVGYQRIIKKTSRRST